MFQIISFKFFSSQNAQTEEILPASENQPEQTAGGGERAAVCAPRVTIDADGNIVLDEERLVNNSQQNFILKEI